MENRKTTEDNKVNGFAITSLILGIVSIINLSIPFFSYYSMIYAIPAIIFGIIGISRKYKTVPAIIGLIQGIFVFLYIASSYYFTQYNSNLLNNNSNQNSNNYSIIKPDFDYKIDNQYSTEYGYIYYVEGTVKNNKSKEYSYVLIKFVCYDSEGNYIGNATDSASPLLENQTWKFKASYIDTAANKIDHCDYYDITAW